MAPDAYLRRGTQDDHAFEVLGFAVLRQQLRDAAFALLAATTPAYRAQELADALLFVRGDGLQQFLERFDLGYQAEELRATFFDWCEHRRTCHAPKGAAAHS